ncbi:TPA: CHAP domain-containing protein [Streptococcus suis]
MSTKKLLRVFALGLLPVLLFYGIALFLLVLLGGAIGGVADCTADTKIENASTSGNVSANSSIDEFVKTYQDAYIESWGAGGFLPSASIAQTMAEVSYNMSVPSFGQAHNMGGVKWSTIADFPKTIELYGPNAVSNNGAGTDVGDGTGGSYAFFQTFEAGIVGKAEFMSNQTLYTRAINNTDPLDTLSAIAEGGWATDPNYKTFLHQMYAQVGQQYKWLDELAIAKYGETPVDKSVQTRTSVTGENSISTETTSKGCRSGSGLSGTATDGTGTIPSDVIINHGYRPDNVPESLKEFIIDPAAMGMEYGSKGGWDNHGSEYFAGQCVALSVSLGNHIWGHKGLVFGDGIAQSKAWAEIFGNEIKSVPKKGAIFSRPGVIIDGVDYGHTGIVSHVFENGSILIVEQNTDASGIDKFGKPYTWNYRIIPAESLISKNYSFAYSDSITPKFGEGE